MKTCWYLNDSRSGKRFQNEAEERSGSSYRRGAHPRQNPENPGGRVRALSAVPKCAILGGPAPLPLQGPCPRALTPTPSGHALEHRNPASATGAETHNRPDTVGANTSQMCREPAGPGAGPENSGEGRGAAFQPPRGPLTPARRPLPREGVRQRLCGPTCPTCHGRWCSAGKGAATAPAAAATLAGRRLTQSLWVQVRPVPSSVVAAGAGHRGARRPRKGRTARGLPHPTPQGPGRRRRLTAALAAHAEGAAGVDGQEPPLAPRRARHAGDRGHRGEGGQGTEGKRRRGWASRGRPARGGACRAGRGRRGRGPAGLGVRGRGGAQGTGGRPRAAPGDPVPDAVRWPGVSSSCDLGRESHVPPDGSARGPPRRSGGRPPAPGGAHTPWRSSKPAVLTSALRVRSFRRRGQTQIPAHPLPRPAGGHPLQG